MMNMTTAALALLCTCPMGEYMLRNCSSTSSAACWPCEPGFECFDNKRHPCQTGSTWSRTGIQCAPCSGPCDEGTVLVRGCDTTTDRVCADCPPGYACNGTAWPCPAGTYSIDGGCVRCPANFSSPAGSASIDDCVCEARTDGGCGCQNGHFFVGGQCRRCPDGYGCEGGIVHLCAENAYSSDGACRPCPPYSTSLSGSSSIDDCQCTAGYVKDRSSLCVACREGTVWRKQGICAPCPAGGFCLGKQHHEICPEDMWSSTGSAVCTDCRPHSNCQRRCTAAVNCTCDNGYIDAHGECTRCAPGSMKVAATRCAPCGPGMECLGGAEVRKCGLATYSPGNRTEPCLRCSACRELTVARCNETADSQCAPTRDPLAILAIQMECSTPAPGEIFELFVLMFSTSTLPLAQVQQVCGYGRRCVDCFQGTCPTMRSLSGPAYTPSIEMRTDARRLSNHLEMLSRTDFLGKSAKETMRRISSAEMTLTHSRVEYSVICPDEGVWNNGFCAKNGAEQRMETWLGLGLGVLGVSILVFVARCGRKIGRHHQWKRLSPPNEEETGVDNNK